MIGIYFIKNTCNGKMYIGQSRNIKKRISKHFQELKAGTHKNSKLQHSYNNYGKNSFEWGMLKECNLEELDNLEVYYISQFDTVSDGYNLEYGGNLHKTLSDETKRKIAEWNLGRKSTEETKRKISQSLRGRPGTPMSEENKKRRSEFMKGNKLKLGKVGNKLSEDTKQKMSIAKIGNSNARGSKRTPEEIQRIIDNNKSRRGRKYTHTDAYYAKRGIPKLDKDL